MHHQRLIPERILPDAFKRFVRADSIGRQLEERGYLRVGLDHFAKPGDALAVGRIGRNLQGYTTDPADALLGIGASAIGRLPQDFAYPSGGTLGDFKVAGTGTGTSQFVGQRRMFNWLGS
jgi:oxygen-independent coproporphyrinogen-3 oxidase